jgi:host cell factor
MVPDRKWFWAFPQIEGVPPSPRGGHSATLIGASILYFGVSHENLEII